jgi:hypothetical protein
MKKLIGNWLTEKTIFYFVLAINVFIILTVRFYPTMDGPSHLYNSNLINNLIFGKTNFISEYFILNKTILPNWIGFFILSVFNLFLPAWIGEKILLLLYLVGITISFRLLIKQLCPQNFGLSIFIFPFAYSFLFYLGFYNFCFSFIFLFLTIYFWIKTYHKKGITKYFILFILVTLTYFSAILTFIFLGFCMGLFAVAFSISDYYQGKNLKQAIQKLARELLSLLIITLPGILWSYIFIKSTNFFPSNTKLSITELFKWIFDTRSLIVYDYAGDEILTRQFFHISIAIFSISAFIRFYNKGSFFNFNKFRKSDLFLIPALICLILLFIIPNGSNAGMMSDRFCLLFYIFIIIFLSSQDLPRGIGNIFIVLIILFHLGLLMKHFNGEIKDLNKDASTIFAASKYIDENSIVLPLNFSDDWLELHFSDYLGIDKPMVILENYEATVSWFPVRWKYDELPNIKLVENNAVNDLKWPNNAASLKEMQIKYVFLYGKLDKIKEPKWSELNSILDKNFELIFTSHDKYVALFKKSTK